MTKWYPVRIATTAEEQLAKEDARRPRYLLDENMDVALAEVITGQGYACNTVRDLGMVGHDDGRIFAAAYAKDLILLTKDRDFRGVRLQNNAGVFVFASGAGETELKHALAHVIAIIGRQRDDWRDAIVRVSDANTWSVDSWIRADGVVDRFRVRFDCRMQNFEIAPRKGVRDVAAMLQRWAILSDV